MKKFVSGVLFAVLALVFVYSFACAGGSGDGGGPVIQAPQELSKYDIYLLEQKVKKQVTKMEFISYKEGSQDWTANYDFTVDVTGGEYDAEWELKAGRYNTVTYAYRGWDYVMHAEGDMNVVGGGVTSFNPILRLNDELRFQLSVPGVPGNYQPGECYQTIVKYSDGTQYSDYCGAWLDGKGDISIDQSLPTKKTNPDVYITDSNGDIHGFKANFNLLEAIDGTEVVIPYTPLSDTGILHVKVGYEMENKGLLVDKNPNFTDGSQDDPTGIRGQAAVKIASYFVSNVTKKKMTTKFVTVHIGNQGDFFSNLWVRFNGLPYDRVVAGLSNNSSYPFYAGGLIEAGETKELEIFADSSLHTSDQQIDPIRVTVGAIDLSTMLSFYQDENVEGQSIYIAESGRLDITRDYLKPATLLKGSIVNHIMDMDFSASGEDFCITEIDFQRFGLSNDSDLGSLALTGPTVSWIASAFLTNGLAKLFRTICIPEGTTARLGIYADVSANAEAGHQFGLNLSKVKATGSSSGKVIELTPNMNSGVFTII